MHRLRNDLKCWIKKWISIWWIWICFDWVNLNDLCIANSQQFFINWIKFCCCWFTFWIPTKTNIKIQVEIYWFYYNLIFLSIVKGESKLMIDISRFDVKAQWTLSFEIANDVAWSVLCSAMDWDVDHRNAIFQFKIFPPLNEPNVLTRKLLILKLNYDFPIVFFCN